MRIELERAAQARAAGVAAPADRPSQRRSAETTGSAALVRADLHDVELRESTRNGLTVVGITGYASVTERSYEMWDMFGPYDEVVSRGAFGKTLAAEPLVEFVLNHGAGGAIPMAHTRNGMLDLAEDGEGFRFDAWCDPRRADVKLARQALERGDLAECSFKFAITQGRWSPDYLEYRIDEVDMHRGDVSLVNYGANPATSAWMRATSDQRLERLAGKVGRALTDPERTSVATVLGALSVADDALDDVLCCLAEMLGVANPDEDGMSEMSQLADDRVVLLERTARAEVARRGLAPVMSLRDLLSID